MPFLPWRYIFSAGASFRTSTSSKYWLWVSVECLLQIEPTFLGLKTRYGMPRVFGLLWECTLSGRLDIGLLLRFQNFQDATTMIGWVKIKYELQVLLAPSLARDPTLITSIRYLASGLQHPWYYHQTIKYGTYLSRQEERIPELCDVGDGKVGCAQQGRSPRSRRTQSQACLWHHSVHLHPHHYKSG